MTYALYLPASDREKRAFAVALYQSYTESDVSIGRGGSPRARLHIRPHLLLEIARYLSLRFTWWCVQQRTYIYGNIL